MGFFGVFSRLISSDLSGRMLFDNLSACSVLVRIVVFVVFVVIAFAFAFCFLLFVFLFFLLYWCTRNGEYEPNDPSEIEPSLAIPKFNWAFFYLCLFLVLTFPRISSKAIRDRNSHVRSFTAHY
jgi:hypothetical protein